MDYCESCKIRKSIGELRLHGGCRAINCMRYTMLRYELLRCSHGLKDTPDHVTTPRVPSMVLT